MKKKQSEIVGQALHEFFVANGAKGGKSKSKRKLAAVTATLAKVRARRWKKKKATA